MAYWQYGSACLSVCLHLGRILSSSAVVQASQQTGLQLYMYPLLLLYVIWSKKAYDPHCLAYLQYGTNEETISTPVQSHIASWKLYRVLRWRQSQSRVLFWRDLFTYRLPLSNNNISSSCTPWAFYIRPYGWVENFHLEPAADREHY